MIGCVLVGFMLAATAIYFVALNLGYGLTDFGYYTFYRTTFVALYIPCSPCAPLQRNGPHPHRISCRLPARCPVEIVLGKFFALCVISSVPPCLADAGHDLGNGRTGATANMTPWRNLAALSGKKISQLRRQVASWRVSSSPPRIRSLPRWQVLPHRCQPMMPSLRRHVHWQQVALAPFNATAAVLSAVAGPVPAALRWAA